MKARLPINKKMKDQVFKFAQEEIERQQKGATRRLYKIMILALALEFGFGKERALRLIRKVDELVRQSNEDEAFFYHLDKRLIEQMGLDFEKEDYEKWDK